MKLNIITLSTRPGRVGPKIGKWVSEFAKEHSDFEIELVDLADFNLPLLDEAKHPRMGAYEHEHTKKWSKSVASADAFVFVTPEYDYFPPASFVNAIQTLSKEWNHKPAGLVSYGGISGGLRGAQTAKILLTAVSIMPLAQEVPIPFFPKFINDEGVFVPNEEMKQGAAGMLAELHKWATAMRPMRAE